MTQEFRRDGWPLCPRCEEDELYSVAMLRWNGLGERPTLTACLKEEFRCYRCNWSGRIEPQGGRAKQIVPRPCAPGAQGDLT
jgi:hypothetical protein